MKALDELVCFTIDGEPVSLRHVLHQAVIGGHMAFIENAIRSRLIERGVARHGIRVSVEEYERYLAVFRDDMGLATDEALSEWLAARRMSRADLEAELRQIMAFGKLKSALVEEKVLPYFAKHQRDFDAAVISKITCEQKPTLIRAMERVAHGDRFRDVARELSDDHRTHLQGGFVGRVRRRDLDPAHAQAIFQAHEGALVGPLEQKRGFVLYFVERVLAAALDSATRSEIHTLLFGAWLDEERAKAKIEVSLAEHL
jgi:hypothetical protein